MTEDSTEGLAENSGRHGNRTLQRLGVGSALIVFVVLVIVVDALTGVPACVIAVTNVAVLIGLVEFGILARRCCAKPFSKMGFVAGIAVLNWPWIVARFAGKLEPEYASAYAHGSIAVLAVVFAVLVMNIRSRLRSETSFNDVAATLMGLVYLALPMSVFLAIVARQGSDAWRLVLWLLASVKLGDMAACTLGNLIGRHKLAPATSPKKTIEGAIASLVATLAASVLLGVLVAGAAPVAAIAVGTVLSITAQIGDLIESALKRSAAAKDSASFMPAFGGMLDVMDSLIFSLPAGAIAAQALDRLPL